MTGLALVGISTIFRVWLGGPKAMPLSTTLMRDVLLMGPLIGLVV